MKRSKRFSLLGDFVILMMISFGCLYCVKDQAPIKQKTMDITDLVEIPQNGEEFVSDPVKIIYYNNKVYIMDRKLLKILVFSEDGYSHDIGQPGKGPGEISMPISFDIFDDEIFVLNPPDRVEIYDIFGNYLDTIKLKIKGHSIPSFWDFKYLNNTFYFSLDFGYTRVQLYSRKGDHLDDFIEGGKSLDHNGVIVSDPYNIYLIPEEKKLILFNQFNGDIEVFHLDTGQLLFKNGINDSIIKKQVSLIKNSVEKRYSNQVGIEAKTYIMLISALDKDTERILLIPSQITIKREEKRNLIYSFYYKSYTLEKNTIHFVNSKPKHIRLLCPARDRSFFLDEELNLYIGGLK